MTWQIRHMNKSDVDNVYAIETSVHVAPWAKNILKNCILVGYNCLVIEIKIDNRWVLGGYMICRHKNDCCHILNFCIAKLFQSQGYGRKFLQYLLDDLIQCKEIQSVILEVRPSNSIALHLYERLGFNQEEIKQEYYKENDQIEDAILLKKNLRT
ncbi:ribosomal protein S18-alanine N-acetyltransferase [Legionella sp.]|uniref:ribosomal protein S18-alanine N-acetyltransferase n=1 Tax=Legionella sp. TaxID=459 RepID=UPI003C9231FE